MSPNWLKALWALFLLASVAQAQFNFFEQMFGGNQGQERQQQNQNSPSDSTRYQKAWDQCEHNFLLPANMEISLTNALTPAPQRNATTTSAPELLPASISHTTARARTPMWKRRWSWERGAPFACPGAGLRMGRRRGRSSWLARELCEDFTWCSLVLVWSVYICGAKL